MPSCLVVGVIFFVDWVVLFGIVELDSEVVFPLTIILLYIVPYGFKNSGQQEE